MQLAIGHDASHNNADIKPYCRMQKIRENIRLRAAFLQALAGLKFRGDLCIEQETGTQRVTDIGVAKQFVGSLLI